MLPFVTENALPKFADRERGPTPYDFDQKFSRSGKSYREVELSPSVASLGQPRRITRQTTLKHSIPKFTLYVSGRARCSSSEAVRLNGKTGRRPKAASWRVGKAPAKPTLSPSMVSGHSHSIVQQTRKGLFSFGKPFQPPCISRQHYRQKFRLLISFRNFARWKNSPIAVYRQ